MVDALPSKLLNPSGPHPPRVPPALTIFRFILAALLTGSGVSCRAPELREEPYAFLAKGRTGLVWKQPLANYHVLEGEFDIGPVTANKEVITPFGSTSDQGKVKGKYEIALGARSYLAENTTIEAGIGYRVFDIEGLSPTDDDDFKFVVDTVDSMQFYLSLRRYFDAHNMLSERWRLFGELGFILAPGVSVDTEIRFESFKQPLSSKADAYYTVAATGGMSYQVSDSLLAEFGVSWEHLLNPLSVDMTTTVDVAGTDAFIPVKAEMTPKGGFIFVSLTWYP
jgi:hypothetical protein